MITLGLSFGHDTGVCLVDSCKGILFAANEERYTRKKKCKEFPIHSLRDCAKYMDEHEIRNIHAIRYTNYKVDNIVELAEKLSYISSYAEFEFIPDETAEMIEAVLDELKDEDSIEHFISTKRHDEIYKTVIADIVMTVTRIISETVDIDRVEHHYAHACCALLGATDKESTIIVTADGFGDGTSMTISAQKARNLAYRKYTYSTLKSIGLVYQFCTKKVGFRPNEQEGKLTGLAARGEPIVDFSDVFSRAEHKFDSINIKDCDMRAYYALEQSVFEILNEANASIEDIAASVQEFTEQTMCKRVEEFCNFNSVDNYVLCLAGGVFANVELNRKLWEHLKAKFNLKRIFIYPNMGDAGLAVGCCYSVAQNANKGHLCNSLFFGEKITEKQIIEALNSEEAFAANIVDCCKLQEDDARGIVIANLVAEGYIVANVVDEMEYGPRALCHRSIHFNCNNKEANTWLNKQLGRTETMPFAPVILKEHALEYLKGFTGDMHDGRYMTMNYIATEEFAELCPSAVHIDGTIRAQVVDPNYEDCYDIVQALECYYFNTGRPAFINTSFNAHGEPIVRTAKQAVVRFIESNIHYLVIGNYVIAHPKIDNLPKFK